jgi:hypothetical protein
MSRISSVGAVAASFLLIGARCCREDCRQTVARVTFDLQRYQSEFGVVNAPQFSLGDILELDLTAKVGARIRSIPPGDTADTTTTLTGDSTEFASGATATVDFGFELSQADKAALTIAVRNYVANSTVLSLRNYRRVGLVDPAARLNATPDAAADIRRRLADPNRVYLIVASLVRADNVLFRDSHSSTTTAEAHVLKVGKINLSVSFDQNARLAIWASGGRGSAFYKVNQLTWDSVADRVRASVSTVNLREFDFSQGIRP